MVNQYSCNLDSPQDYLVHGKLGAHYSKKTGPRKNSKSITSGITRHIAIRLML